LKIAAGMRHGGIRAFDENVDSINLGLVDFLLLERYMISHIMQGMRIRLGFVILLETECNDIDGIISVCLYKLLK